MSSGSTTKKQPIPGYTLIKKLGEGGMGAVYQARQNSMDREVALKILPKRLANETDFKERFFREARAAGALSHGNIVSAIDASEAGGYCYIAMEFVDGETLADRIDRDGSLEEKTALEIILQVASGLVHAWAADIVHRDVKPENILLTNDGVPKLCDLGIAKAPADSNLTQEGMALGTPRYISPEQAQAKGEITFRSDIYSLGATLYHAIAGEPPFDGPSGPAIMLKHVTDPLVPLVERAPGVGKQTSRLVDRMMAKDPADRYADPETFLEDIRRALEGAPLEGTRPRPARTSGKAKGNKTRRRTSVRRAVRSSTRRTKAIKVRKRSSSNGMFIVALVFLILVAILGFLLLGGR